MKWLRQSTVAVINWGPVLDKTDGVTLEEGAGIITSIDHATTGIMLSKNGGVLAVREQGANFVASTYDAHGFYKVSLSAIDTGTLGRLLIVHTEPATYLAVWKEFMVIPAQVWDSFFGSDKLDVAVVEMTADAISAAALSAAAVAKIQAGLAMLGTGPVAKDYTLTDAITGLPIADALVWITTDIGGANVICSGRTNALGIVTFHPDVPVGTTLYIWRYKAGENFTNPDIEVL